MRSQVCGRSRAAGAPGAVYRITLETGSRQPLDVGCPVHALSAIDGCDENGIVVRSHSAPRPGEWVAHCHLRHQDRGMMTVLRVP